MVSHTFSPVRVHGDFAAQDGTHAFAWKGRGGATVEMRIRFSLRFRRDRRRRRNGDDKSCGNEWAIMEHCAFVTMPGASPAEISPLSPPPPPASAVRPDEKVGGRGQRQEVSCILQRTASHDVLPLMVRTIPSNALSTCCLGFSTSPPRRLRGHGSGGAPYVLLALFFR